MAHIPEDRHKDGLVLDYTLQENLVLQSYYTRRFQNHGFLKFDAIRQYAKMLIEKFDIRSSQGEKSIARGMSGGNQQKIVISKWLAAAPKVLIMDEPTRGIDVGAKAEIYKLMHSLAEAGVSIIMISSELPEIINNSSRIVVMREGRITGILDQAEAEASQETIMSYAVGGECSVC